MIPIKGTKLLGLFLLRDGEKFWWSPIIKDMVYTSTSTCTEELSKLYNFCCAAQQNLTKFRHHRMNDRRKDNFFHLRIFCRGSTSLPKQIRLTLNPTNFLSKANSKKDIPDAE
jgi:hypothetical protein